MLECNNCLVLNKYTVTNKFKWFWKQPTKASNISGSNFPYLLYNSYIIIVIIVIIQTGIKNHWIIHIWWSFKKYRYKYSLSLLNIYHRSIRKEDRRWNRRLDCMFFLWSKIRWRISKLNTFFISCLLTVLHVEYSIEE